MKDEELERAANDVEPPGFVRRLRRVEDFRYDEVQEKYWDITTGILLGAKSVDGAIPKADWPATYDAKGNLKPIKPSLAINDVMTGLTVEGSTWWPGEGAFLLDRVVTSRGAIRKKGATTYNTYIAPDRSGLEGKTFAEPVAWLEHVRRLYPDPVESEHFLDYAAHMIQRPDEKVNHGIVIAGRQGIGKDTMLLPLRHGVGEWNCAEIEPDAIHRPYNEFAKSVMLIINEVRPHDEDFRASNFYNQLKPYLAAPPEVLPMEVKYQNTIFIRNLCHVFLTTNDPLSMYIPPEDRRLAVLTSPISKESLPPSYFENLWGWLLSGGVDSVIAYLLGRAIPKDFCAKPPPTTTGKEDIIGSAEHIRRSPIDDVFEHYCSEVLNETRPKIFFPLDLIAFVNASDYFDDKQSAIKAFKAKNASFKLAERGYSMLKNPHAPEWKNGKFRSRTAYVHESVPREERVVQVLDELKRRPLEFRIPNA